MKLEHGVLKSTEFIWLPLPPCSPRPEKQGEVTMNFGSYGKTRGGALTRIQLIEIFSIEQTRYKNRIPAQVFSPEEITRLQKIHTLQSLRERDPGFENTVL